MAEKITKVAVLYKNDDQIDRLLVELDLDREGICGYNRIVMRNFSVEYESQKRNIIRYLKEKHNSARKIKRIRGFVSNSHLYAQVYLLDSKICNNEDIEY